MKEKDELTKSQSLNKLYLEMNLVVGYLELPQDIVPEPPTPQTTNNTSYDEKSNQEIDAEKV